MLNYNVNDTVHIKGRGDCAIAAKRYIQRGRHAGRAEYTLASLKEGGFGKAFAMRVVGEGFFHPTKGTYSASQIAEAVAKVHQTKERIADNKEKRAARGREVLGGWTSSNVNPGDEVQIRYREGTKRWEKVVKVNSTTGKVAVVSRGKRGYRWIPAQQIVDVKKG